MTNLKIDYNRKPITKVESGDFLQINIIIFIIVLKKIKL